MRKFMVVFAAIFLLTVTAYAEGFPVRDKIHIGDPVETILYAEPLGIMYHQIYKDGRSGIVTTNKGNIFGNSGSYIEYVIDEAADLSEANFIFGTNSSLEVLQTQYDYIESELSASYGKSLGGIFGANKGVNGYTYRFYDAYKSGFSSYPDIVGFSERVVILENYNVKIEHLLLRRSSDYGEEYHHYLCYKKFLDSEAPKWAKKKEGFVYVDNSGKFAPTIAPAEMPDDTITPESSEESIANMQKMLVGVGVLSGDFDDGVYGNETMNAVSLFQRWVNSELKEAKLMPTGLCDPDTFENLEFAYEYNMVCPEKYAALKPIVTTFNQRGAEMLEITGATYDDRGVAVVSASSIDVRWNPDPEVDKYALVIYRIEDLTKKEPLFKLQTKDEFATIDMANFTSGTYTLCIGARNANTYDINWMDTIFRMEGPAPAADFRVAESAPAVKKDKGIWMMKYFVDEFDEPTDDAYVTHLREIEGSFSNSAVDDRELKCRLLVSDSGKVQIFLYEYGDNLVKNPFSRSIDYKISVLDSEKNKHSLKGYYWERSDRLVLSGAQCDAVIQALSLGGKVKFHIESTESLDEYQFTIEDATGFDVAYEEMMKKQNK